MTPNSKPTRRLALLALALLAISLPPTADAGVISDMMARRRASKQLKAQATTSTIKGQTMTGESGSISMAEHTAQLQADYGLSMPGDTGSKSLAGRFKKRFSLEGRGQGMTPMMTNSSDRDPGLFKTSR